MYKNGIYGAVIGDIAGSLLEIKEMRNKTPNAQEREKILNKNIPLLNNQQFYTDDTILTCALCDALLNDMNFSKFIRFYGKREIALVKMGERNKFGKYFTEWCNGADFNSSFGNGCAMRISPVGYFSDSEKELEEKVVNATICTHNHPDSLKCALATAKAIYLAKNNATKDEIKHEIENILGMKLDFNLDDLRKNYTFTAKAINSVPQALYCFIAANDFEQTVRLALSMGGDTDTNAAIAGSVAGAYYGIDDELVNIAKKYLPEHYLNVFDKFNEKMSQKINAFNKEEL